MVSNLTEFNDFKYEVQNDIVIGTLKAKYVDLNLANALTKKRLAIQFGKPYPLLSNIKGIKTVTKEARDFLASKEGCEGVIAAAVLIDSYIGSMIGNFFIKISNPIVPTKIFTDETTALKWLERHKQFH